jgi:hypothetical protein
MCDISSLSRSKAKEFYIYPLRRFVPYMAHGFKLLLLISKINKMVKNIDCIVFPAYHFILFKS